MSTVADVERRSYEGELLFIVEVCHAMANLVWCGVNGRGLSLYKGCPTCVM